MFENYYQLYQILAAIIFSIGLLGLFINRRNVIGILLSIELLLLAVNINFIANSAILQNLDGQIFSLFVLCVAAAETAIGLAIIVVFYRLRNSISIDDLNKLKG